MHQYAAQPKKQNPGGEAPGISPSSPDASPLSAIRMPAPEVIGELMAIAQRIGGDFRMTVRVGKAGCGSFFNPEACSITLDPVHILHSPLFAKFVAGHEGSHRAITMNLIEIGMSEEEATFYLSHIGFHAGFNGCEDNAVNTWMQKVFPGMEGPTSAVYNEMFCRANVEVQLPAIEIARQQLGRYPRFGYYISEIIRDWHMRSFSPTLDDDVRAALDRTIDAVRRYTGIIPDSGSSRAERIQAMEARFDIYRHDVWPHLQQLVELDLQNEAEHQLLKEILQKRVELNRLKAERDGVHADDGPSGAERRDARIKQLENELEKLDEEAGGLLELDEEMEEMLREAAEQLAKKLEELGESVRQLRKDVIELQAETTKLQAKLKAAKTREERERALKELRKKEREVLEALEALEKAERELASLQSGRGAGGGGGAAIDMSKLSAKTQEALRKLFSKLSSSGQSRLRNKAENALKAFDDGVSDELKGKLNEPNETHADREPKDPRHGIEHCLRRYLEKSQRNFEIDREDMRRSREDLVSGGVSPWDRALHVMGDQVEALYLRLKRFFRPQADPSWDPDYPSGGRLNLDRVMQSEADPRMLERLWERRGIPRTFDYRFSFLVDISGSMHGAKAEETFKALVVLAEVLERLRIPYEIACFGSFFCNLKPFKEKLTNPSRLFVAQSLLSSGGGTMDAWAVRCAYKRLLANLGKENFLVVMTDGESGMAGELAMAVAEIGAEGKVKLMGLGLGKGTGFVRTSYPHGVGNIPMRLSKREREAGKLEFIDVVSILIEDMLKHPERYGDKSTLH